MTDKELEVFTDAPIDRKHVDAFNAIRSKRIPKEAISERPGKAGKKFTYVDHIWVTETLQDGLRNMWSFEVLDWEVYNEKLKIKDKVVDSRSVVARVQLTIHIPIRDITGGGVPFLNRTITEVGVFEPNPAMSTAFAVASAVSRGLCRAVMRGLGLGIEFYKGEDGPLTSAGAWTTLRDYARNQGQDPDDKEFTEKFYAALKEAGISKENLADRWQEAYYIINVVLGFIKPPEDMPEEI